MERRDATPDEVRALANPLRLRLIRLCNREARTNRELADEVGRDPGTVLHHVRVLVDTGFLVQQEVRQGASGALEKPYLSTGKSWRLSFPQPDGDGGTWTDAGLEAFREEFYAAGPQRVRGGARFDLRLTDATAAEFRERIMAVVEEFVARDEPAGDWYGAYFGLHLMPTRTPVSDPPDPPGSAGTPRG